MALESKCTAENTRQMLGESCIEGGDSGIMGTLGMGKACDVNENTSTLNAGLLIGSKSSFSRDYAGSVGFGHVIAPKSDDKTEWRGTVSVAIRVTRTTHLARKR